MLLITVYFLISANLYIFSRASKKFEVMTPNAMATITSFVLRNGRLPSENLGCRAVIFESQFRHIQICQPGRPAFAGGQIFQVGAVDFAFLSSTNPTI